MGRKIMATRTPPRSMRLPRPRRAAPRRIFSRINPSPKQTGPTHGQAPIRHQTAEHLHDAAGRSLHHRERSGRAFLLLRDALDPHRVHDGVSREQDGAALPHGRRGSAGLVRHFCFRCLFPSHSGRHPGGGVSREIQHDLVAFDRLLPRTSGSRLHGHGVGHRLRSGEGAGHRSRADRTGLRRD